MRQHVWGEKAEDRRGKYSRPASTCCVPAAAIPADESLQRNNSSVGHNSAIAPCSSMRYPRIMYTIHTGDCLTILPTLAAQSVHLVYLDMVGGTIFTGRLHSDRLHSAANRGD